MKKINVSVLLLASAMLLTSCDLLKTSGSETEPYAETAAVVQETAVAVEASETSAAVTEQTAVSSQTTAATETSADETETSETAEALEGEALTEAEMLEFFSTYADEYIMSSGAGGWAAYLDVNPSGSFSYNYHDFDAGSYYICHAAGQFANMTKIDDQTYTVEVIYMTYEYDEGTEWTETDTDGIEINYVASDSYGIHEGDTLTFYVEGHALADLPEGYVVWYVMPRALPLENAPDPFPLSGFYNPVDDCAYIEDDYE